MILEVLVWTAFGLLPFSKMRRKVIGDRRQSLKYRKKPTDNPICEGKENEGLQESCINFWNFLHSASFLNPERNKRIYIRKEHGGLSSERATSCSER